MNSGDLHVALIDDEPLMLNSLASSIREHVNEDLNISTFTGPTELQTTPSTNFTHAIIELSFGGVGESRRSAIDAIDFIASTMPLCRIAVLGRFETPWHLEVATAIRQTFPSVPFFVKQDSQLVRRVVEFVRGEAVRDVAEISLLLMGVEPLLMSSVSTALKSSMQPGSLIRLLDVLSGHDELPSTEELSEALGMSTRTVRNRLSELSTTLSYVMVEERGLSRLWLWARARRAILVRELNLHAGSEQAMRL